MVTDADKAKEVPRIDISDLAETPETYSALLAYECYWDKSFTEVLRRGKASELVDRLKHIYQRSGKTPPANLEELKDVKTVVHENDDTTWNIILSPE